MQAGNEELLERFADAWNNHDIDELMICMTEDCIFETAAGDDAWGTRFRGAAEVRNRFSAVWQDISDAHWSQFRHFVVGDRGLSEWLFTGSTKEGNKIEIKGCDVFTFRDGKIFTKSTFLKRKS